MVRVRVRVILLEFGSQWYPGTDCFWIPWSYLTRFWRGFLASFAFCLIFFRSGDLGVCLGLIGLDAMAGWLALWIFILFHDFRSPRLCLFTIFLSHDGVASLSNLTFCFTIYGFGIWMVFVFNRYSFSTHLPFYPVLAWTVPTTAKPGFTWGSIEGRSFY